MNADKHR